MDLTLAIADGLTDAPLASCIRGGQLNETLGFADGGCLPVMGGVLMVPLLVLLGDLDWS
eukprot:SAG22_NODE_3_length_48349_cov_158.681180_23_plen_59_part_00